MRYLKRLFWWFIVLWIGMSALFAWRAVDSESKRLVEVVRLESEKLKQKGYEVELDAEGAKILKWRMHYYVHIFSSEEREKANVEMEKARRKQEEYRKKIEACEEEIKKIELFLQRCDQENATEKRGDGVAIIILHAFKDTIVRALMAAIFMAILLPTIWALVAFYLLAPLVKLWRPFYPIRDGEKQNNTPNKKNGETGEKNLPITIAPGEIFTVRDEKYVALREVGGMSHEYIFLYSWHYPIMSICCGLTGLVSYKANAGKPQELRISSDNPDEYFCVLDLPPGEQLIILPSDLIAFSKDISLKSRWILSPHAFCTGQIRFFILQGPERKAGQQPARIVVRSSGGVTSMQIKSTGYALKRHSLIVASARVRIGAKRTESFWNYFNGQSDLFDLYLSGAGEVRIHNARLEPATLVDKTVKFILNAIGNLLGF